MFTFEIDKKLNEKFLNEIKSKHRLRREVIYDRKFALPGDTKILIPKHWQ